MFKKALLLAIALVLFGGAFVKAACTPEEFQKELVSMQATMAEVTKDADKFAKANAAFEEKYSAEIMELAQLTQAAAGDPSKTQEMLDKGCDLYRKMNETLNEYK